MTDPVARSSRLFLRCSAPSRWGAVGLVAFLVPALAAASPLRFHLVPPAAWHDGRPDLARALPAGSVHLFGVGGRQLELAAEIVAEVPPGSWTWLAEAPGYVSVRPWAIDVGPDDGGAVLDVALPVVAACPARLAEPAAWRGVDLLEIVSLTQTTLYAVVPRGGAGLQVPAGDAIVYTVGPRGLGGIGRLVRCSPERAEAAVSIRPPPPPPATRQDLLIEVALPEEAAALRHPADLLLAVRPAGAWGQGGEGPAARIRVGNRILAFFFGLAADRELEVVARHPHLRTAISALPAFGGGARRIAVVARPRRSLTLRVRYRPRRDHRLVELDLVRCWPGQEPEPGGKAKLCRPLGRARRLETGVHEYSFGDLDDGAYAPEAVIDDRRIRGLASGVRILLGPADDDLPPPRSAELLEMEVYGQLLDDGEPVAGEVRVTRGREVESFPTGPDLFYHLYYFGLPAAVADALPGDDDRPSDETRGLGWAGIEACGRDGACRILRPDSVIRGEGRLDLELGADRRLRVHVFDQDSGQPLRGARVWVPATHDRLVFDDGEVRWEASKDPRPLVAKTDGGGVALLRGLEAGEVGVTAELRGYGAARASGKVPVRGTGKLEVALVSEERRPGDILFHLPGGRPLSSGFLAAVGPSGHEPACSREINARGAAHLPEDCLGRNRFILLHSDVRLAVLDGRRLAAERDVEVVPAPEVPLRLRAVDAAGRPVAGLAVRIDLGGVVLEPSELDQAAGRGSDVVPFGRTDAAGEMLLWGLDPQAPEAPILTPAGVPDAPSVPLAGYRPGETVEVVIGPPGAG